MGEDETFGPEDAKLWWHRHGPGFGGPGFGGPGPSHGRRGGGRRGFGMPWMGDIGGWPGDPGARGPRVKRGDVRSAILALLAEEPRNGYQIIQEIGERSGGVWHPSPGSVYPALAQLEDEGLVAAETPEGGRKRYVLTEEGRDYVAAHPAEAAAPWDTVASSVGHGAKELRGLVGEVAVAAIQVFRVGNDAHIEQAQQVLADTRRRLYRILAADEDEAG